MPSSDEHKKLLGETNLFSGISEETLDRIATIASERRCEAKETLYDPGDEATDFYALVSGSVRFVLENRTGMLSSGAVMRSRMIFGWAALVPEHPRRLGSAQCLESSTLLVMNGDKVLRELRNDPESGLKTMERLCGMIARNFMDQR